VQSHCTILSEIYYIPLYVRENMFKRNSRELRDMRYAKKNRDEKLKRKWALHLVVFFLIGKTKASKTWLSRTKIWRTSHKRHLDCIALRRSGLCVSVYNIYLHFFLIPPHFAFCRAHVAVVVVSASLCLLISRTYYNNKRKKIYARKIRISARSGDED